MIMVIYFVFLVYYLYMRTNINIYNNEHIFNYMVEYNQEDPTKIRLYIPSYSLAVYEKNIKYKFGAKLWLNDKYEDLIIDYKDDIEDEFRSVDTYAAPRPLNYMSNTYYEYMEFYIKNPYELLKENNYKDNSSSLYISLKIMDNDNLDNLQWIGGQNSIPLYKDDMRFVISTNINEIIGTSPAIKCNILYPERFESISEYLESNYGITNFSFRYSLVIGNESMLYYMCESVPTNKLNYSFDKKSLENIFENRNSKYLIDGKEWREGIFITCSVDILNEYGESILYLLSNELPLTFDIISYFINTNDNDIYNINLDLVNMEVFNINAINKIENKTIHIDTTCGVKSNIIQPVFFKSLRVMDLIIHPDVTETISINLDDYKSKVETFIIQIENVQFIEIGRNATGILFKIIGKKLPGSLNNGTYFILNEKYEMVTSGKYTYER